MDFSEFANRLKEIIGGSTSTVMFTSSLFDAITPAKDAYEDMSDNTFKAYFNGNTSISRLAKKILPTVNTDRFMAYIEGFEDSLQRLSDSFLDVISDINPCNCAEKLADLFESIIVEAARKKRKTPTSIPPGTNISKEQHKIIGNMTNALLQFANNADTVVRKATEKSKENKGRQAEDRARNENIDNEEREQAKDSGGNTIIQNQNNVIQHGDNNVNITNNGTLNLNL